MATRRRDAGNSDLKARLGIQDAPEAEEIPAAPAESPVSESASEATYAEASSAPAAPAWAGESDVVPSATLTAAASEFAHEDYSSVSDDEIEKPVAAVAKDWRDSEAFAAPVQPPPNKVWVGLAIGGTIVGLLLGTSLGKVSEANGIYNAQTEQAVALQEPVAKSTTRLAALVGEFETKKADKYDASVDEILAAAVAADSGLIISPASLNGSRMVLADSNVGGAVTGLMSSLQTLDSLIKRHLALTQVDLPEIQAEIAGTADQTKYAIVFDVKAMQARYQAHTENPTPTGYQLVPGFRVPFPDDAEVKEVRQGSGVDYFYELRMPNGSNAMVPIYGLVSIDRSQLESGGNKETAQSRWVARVAQIRTLIAEIQVTAGRATTAVEELGARGKRFSF